MNNNNKLSSPAIGLIIGFAIVSVLNYNYDKSEVIKSTQQKIAENSVESNNKVATEDYWMMAPTRQYFYCAGYLTRHYEIVANEYVARSMAAGFEAKLTQFSNKSKLFKEEKEKFFPIYFKRGYSDRSYLVNVNEGYDRGQTFVLCAKKFNGY